MGTKYSREFKEDAVSLLNTLKRENYVKIDGEKIYNVRRLCIKLSISSYSLYEWAKKFKGEATKTDYNLPKNNGKTHKSEKENWELPEGKLILKSEIRLWGLIASALGIKGYNHMGVNELQYNIGLELIKRSKYIDFDIEALITDVYKDHKESMKEARLRKNE